MPIKLIYLAGWGRSGTTVLGGLLGQLPGAAYIGELWNLWEDAFARDDTCGCGLRYSACPFWQELFDELGIDRAKGLELYHTKLAALGTRALLRGPPNFKGKLAEYANVQAAVYRLMASHFGADILVDSSKTPNLLYILAGLPEIEVKIIHVVRDPRAVAYSWFHRAKRRRPGASDVAGETMARHNPVRSTAGWLARNYFVEKATRDTALDCITLRYEDFSREPEATLQAIISRFALPEATLDNLTSPREGLHAARGNPVRFEAGEKVIIRSDDQWKSELPLSQKMLVTALAAPQLGRYRYPLLT